MSLLSIWRNFRGNSTMQEFAEMVREIQARLKNSGGGTVIITENTLEVSFK